MSCHKYVGRVRERFEISAPSLAKLMMVHPSTINAWERGNVCPTGGNRVTLWLLGDERIGSQVFHRLLEGLKEAGLIDELN